MNENKLLDLARVRFMKNTRRRAEQQGWASEGRPPHESAQDSDSDLTALLVRQTELTF